MDPLTRQLVETVRQITEAARRDPAKIFANMDEWAFNDYIKHNPGGAELARKLRAQGLGGQRTAPQYTTQTQTPTEPETPSYTVSDTVRNTDVGDGGYEKYWAKRVDEWTGSGSNKASDTPDLERYARRTKNPELHEKLIQHPRAEMRIWASKNPLTTSEHLHDLLQDPDLRVRIGTVSAPGFSEEHMKRAINQSVSSIENAKTDEEHLDHVLFLRNVMHERPELYTTDMHQTLTGHANPDVRRIANTWAAGGREPVASGTNRLANT